MNSGDSTKHDEGFPVLHVRRPKMEVFELVKLALPLETKKAVRKRITSGEVELNGKPLIDPGEIVVLKTGDLFRAGKGAWYRIEVVKTERLETERLILRTMTVEDIDFLQQYIPQWEIVKYLTKPTSMKVAESVAREVFKKVIMKPEPKDEWLWTVTTKKEPEKVVGVAHVRTDSEHGNNNIWLDPQLQQEGGYMTEIVGALGDFSFNIVGMERIIFKDAFEHAAMTVEREQLKRVIQRRELTREFTDREDTEVLELTRAGWKKARTMFKNVMLRQEVKKDFADREETEHFEMSKSGWKKTRMTSTPKPPAPKGDPGGKK